MNIRPSLAHILATVVFSFFVMLSEPGCVHAKTAKTKVVTAAGTSLTQSGPAEAPAKVDTSKGNVEIPIPANSKVEVTDATPTEPAKITVTVPTETKLTASTTQEHVTAAKDFSPPSPTELAKANAVQWYFVAGGVLVLASLALVYLQHYKAAGFAAAGAFLVPCMGQLVSSESAMRVCIAVVCIVGALVAAWYLIDGKVDGKLSNNKLHFPNNPSQ